jgi:uncharacterized protein
MRSSNVLTTFMVNKLQICVCVQQSPGVVLEHALDVPAGCTVLQALEALAQQRPIHLAADPSSLCEQGLVGVWGRKSSAMRVLEPHDRLEIYRPLLVDPKVARRQRFGQQGARSAGLFAKRRPGAKPGY